MQCPLRKRSDGSTTTNYESDSYAVKVCKIIIYPAGVLFFMLLNQMVLKLGVARASVKFIA